MAEDDDDEGLPPTIDVDLPIDLNSSSSSSYDEGYSSSSSEDEKRQKQQQKPAHEEDEAGDEDDQENVPPPREPSLKEKNVMREVTEKFVRVALRSDDEVAAHLIDVYHAIDVRTDIVGCIQAVVDKLDGLRITKRQGSGEAIMLQRDRRGPLPHGKQIDIDVGAWNSSLDIHEPYGRFSVARTGGKKSMKDGRTLHRIVYTRMSAPVEVLGPPAPASASSGPPLSMLALGAPLRDGMTSQVPIMSMGKAFSAKTVLSRRRARSGESSSASVSSVSTETSRQSWFEDPPMQSRIVMAVMAGQYNRWPRVAPADTSVLQTVVEMSNPECATSSRMAPRGVWEHLVKCRAEAVLCEASPSFEGAITEDPVVASAVCMFVSDRTSQDKTSGRVILLDRLRDRDVEKSIVDIMDLIVGAVGGGAEAMPYREVGRVVIKRGDRYVGAFSIDPELDDLSGATVYGIAYTPFGARRTKDSYIRYMLNMKQIPYID